MKKNNLTEMCKFPEQLGFKRLELWAPSRIGLALGNVWVCWLLELKLDLMIFSNTESFAHIAVWILQLFHCWIFLYVTIQKKESRENPWSRVWRPHEQSVCKLGCSGSKRAKVLCSAVSSSYYLRVWISPDSRHTDGWKRLGPQGSPARYSSSP